MKYKLGAKSSFFHDPQTGFMVYPGDEVEIPENKKTKKVKKAISAGHLMAIEDPNNKEVEVKVETPNPEFKAMTDLKQGVLRTLPIDTIKSVVETLGFDEEDMEKVNTITVKKDLIPAVLEMAKGYSDEDGEEK